MKHQKTKYVIDLDKVGIDVIARGDYCPFIDKTGDMYIERCFGALPPVRCQGITTDVSIAPEVRNVQLRNLYLVLLNGNGSGGKE